MAKYPAYLLEHFRDPKNVGEILNPDGIGTACNVSCGDIMQMFIKVNGDRIAEATFKTFGCGAAIATSSILTERIKGATLEEALKISEETSEEVLSQLPKEKVPCFTLATDALKLAIEECRCKKAGVHEKGGFDMSKMEKD
jgi:nitrogen fixation NifU-like protein